jgi:hypothetical protein
MDSKYFGIRFRIDFKQTDWREHSVQKVVDDFNQI